MLLIARTRPSCTPGPKTLGRLGRTAHSNRIRSARPAARFRGTAAAAMVFLPDFFLSDFPAFADGCSRSSRGENSLIAVPSCCADGRVMRCKVGVRVSNDNLQIGENPQRYHWGRPSGARHEMGRQSRKRKRRRRARPWRRRVSHRRRQHRARHGRHRAARGLASSASTRWRCSVCWAVAAVRRPCSRCPPRAAGRRADGAVRVGGAGRHRGRVDASCSRRRAAPTASRSCVLFRGSTPTACGQGQAAMGPFYCPGDQKVYIDLRLLRDAAQRARRARRLRAGLRDRARGRPPRAEPAGHHATRSTRCAGACGEAQANALTVRLELQADCFAGVWAHHAQAGAPDPRAGRHRGGAERRRADRRRHAAAPGAGHVVPESFTHGTQRAARALVQARPADRQHAAVQYLRGAAALAPQLATPALRTQCRSARPAPASTSSQSQRTRCWRCQRSRRRT